MPSFMLVGKTGCGKTSFCQALHGAPLTYRKTQAIEVVNSTLDTPGEYLENRRLNKALQISSTNVDVVVFIQDCTDEQHIFTPNLASMFFGKPLIGIVSKIDKGSPVQQGDAERILTEAGCHHIIRVSSITGEGLNQFWEKLESLT